MSSDKIIGTPLGPILSAALRAAMDEYERWETSVRACGPPEERYRVTRYEDIYSPDCKPVIVAAFPRGTDLDEQRHKLAMRAALVAAFQVTWEITHDGSSHRERGCGQEQ